MRMLLSSARTSTLTMAVVFMTALVGCASPPPLTDETATTASADNSGASTPAAMTDAASGVQTVKHRRFLGIFSPYRIDIQQGNFVSKEMLAQVKEGMTRDQVRFALGTPLLTDLFHEDRWDYVFRLQKGNGEVTSSRVTIFFNGNLLSRIDGGNLPTEQDYLSQIAGSDKHPVAKFTEPNPVTPPAPERNLLNPPGMDLTPR